MAKTMFRILAPAPYRPKWHVWLMDFGSNLHDLMALSDEIADWLRANDAEFTRHHIYGFDIEDENVVTMLSLRFAERLATNSA